MMNENQSRWEPSTFGFDWQTMKPGTVILIEHARRPPSLPPLENPDPVGLTKVIMARVRKHEHKYADGSRFVEHEPVFITPDDPKRREVLAFGSFAYADDPEQVERLRVYITQERAAEAAQEAERKAAQAAEQAKRAEEAKRRREERDQELIRLAAEQGVSLDELKAGIDVWNRIRRKRYGEKACLICGRTLTDPASIVTGVGPECVKQFPGLKAAARAKVLDVGRMRWDGERLIKRFERAGVSELVTVVADATAAEGRTGKGDG